MKRDTALLLGFLLGVFVLLPAGCTWTGSGYTWYPYPYDAYYWYPYGGYYSGPYYYGGYPWYPYGGYSRWPYRSYHYRDYHYRYYPRDWDGDDRHRVRPRPPQSPPPGRIPPPSNPPWPKWDRPPFVRPIPR